MIGMLEAIISEFIGQFLEVWKMFHPKIESRFETNCDIPVSVEFELADSLKFFDEGDHL